MATVAPALFQTRCSACDAIQTVTPEALKTQNGLLRCSECGATFNAAWSLVDQIPNPARLTQFVPASPEPVLPEFEPDSYGDSSAGALRNVEVRLYCAKDERTRSTCAERMPLRIRTP